MVKKFALEGLSNMARDAALQTLLVGSGIIWQLVRSLLMYDPSLEEVNVDNDEQVREKRSDVNFMQPFEFYLTHVHTHAHTHTHTHTQIHTRTQIHTHRSTCK